MDVLHVATFALLWLYQEVKADLMIKAPGLELLYTVTDYDHCLVDVFRLQLFVGRNIENCITECALRPHCQALTYHQTGTASICEIFQTEGSETDVKQTGCVYIQRNNITINKIPCTPECENDTTCNIVTQSCDRTECTNLPNITYGRILGNLRAVGNKIRFQCDVGNRTEREATCQPDGNWSVGTVTCIRTCGNHWVAYQEYCYLFGTADMSFDSAVNYCEMLGGNLVSIRDSDENDFIQNHLRQIDAEKFWIGMTDEEAEGVWVWLDTNEPATYVNWSITQPNNGRASNCAAIWASFDYNYVDEPCNNRWFRPICKK